MTAQVKICGITTREALNGAAEAGARYAGFVFVEHSRRFLTADAASGLLQAKPHGIKSVALFADPDDAALDRVLARIPFDFIQLHGNEAPARIAAIKARYNKPIIKALAVSSAADLAGIQAYDRLADHLLFDAKPPAGVTVLTGGHGIAFDWTILEGFTHPQKWFLAGGLNPDNVAEAIQLTGAPAVDVSSGVEDPPGQKNVARIKAFLAAVKGA